MNASLIQNAYGKSAVRLTKVVRDRGPVHTLFEIDAAVQLQGFFASAYTKGDNRNVIATDTIKNTIYVLAKRHRFDSVEEFALIITKHFLDTYSHVTKVTAELTQSSWQRIVVDGKPHDHAFTSGGPQLRYAKADQGRGGKASVIGGIRDLLVLKTGGSEWRDFHSDEYRTLKDTSDRVLATKVDATWWYNKTAGDFTRACRLVDEAMLKAFATNHSLGAQQTIFHMGEAALAACDAIDSIHFELPNLHRIPFNFEPFGLTFENDIFVATDTPYGLISGTVSRAKP
jgi:urate oxidase